MLELRVLYTILATLGLTLNVLAIDVANEVDENNLKQGHWIYTNKMKNLPNYKEEQVVEEGDYSDDKKTGKWFFYFNNDKVKHILTYKDNHPDGLAVFYYKNGNKREEGTWKNNKWIGAYKYYYKNGNIRNDWSYNQTGQRTGVQKYYHENGQLMIEGAWVNGKEAGTIVEYYDDGSVKAERNYMNGKIDVEATKVFKPQEKAGKVTVKKVPTVAKVKDIPALGETPVNMAVKPIAKKTASPWNGTGQRQFFNKKGQVIREGYFEKGYLINGNVYMYTADGKKFRTTVYKLGKVTKEINHQNKSE
ncbi:toxin-antitoxin system YwqK family antitoxin [Flavobacteriales bacterium]|nr:toxin-antitoxin system YwqK family antitoxin [Flavobacteriales bacterium]